MPDSTVAALAIRDPEAPTMLVRPAASMLDIETAFKEYQRLCSSLLTNDDYQQISGKRFKKKSAWRKLAVAFGVTFEIRDRAIIRDENNNVAEAEFVVRAEAPNGRFSDGWGACSVIERCCPLGCRNGSSRHTHCVAAKGERCPGSFHFSHANHDIPATAETRAKNRAASDLFGMGEVSAEEMQSSTPEGKGISEPVGTVETVPVGKDEEIQQPPSGVEPLEPYEALMSEATMRRLHAAGKAVGLDHVGIRQAIGVYSLKQVSEEDALRQISRFEKATVKP